MVDDKGEVESQKTDYYKKTTDGSVIHQGKTSTFHDPGGS
jgi:hypothetical protein